MDFKTVLSNLQEAKAPKAEKKYEITKTKSRDGREYKSGALTLPELIKYYSNTLETGASYSHEKGNAKINTNPKNIAALVKNLDNASNNAAANGYAGLSWSYEEVSDIKEGKSKQAMEDYVEKICTCDGGCSFEPTEHEKNCPARKYLKDNNF